MNALLLNMKKRFLHFIPALFCMVVSGVAQDTIVFNNGDTLSGNIIEQNDEQISFISSALGTVTLPTTTIAEIRLHLEDLGEVTVPAEAIQPPPPAPAPLPAPTPPPKTPSKWSGQAGLTIYMQTIQHGEAIAQDHEVYETNGHLKRDNPKNSLRWDWTYIHKEDQFRTYQNEIQLLQTYNHHLRDGYYAEAKTAYRRRISVQNEFLQTAELGKKWFDKPKFKLSTSIGGGYNQYEINGDSTKHPNLIIDEKMRWQVSNSLTLIQEFLHMRTFTRDGETEKSDTNFVGGLENKLVFNLFLRLEYRRVQNIIAKSSAGNKYEEKLLSSLIYRF